jgi:hypothetical protein
MEGWRPRADRRRRAVFVAALAGHGALVGAMLLARVTLQRSADTSTVMATLWQAPPPPVAALQPAPLARPRVTPAPRLRALASPAAAPDALWAPPIEAATAASAPAPVASAASAPLNLTLSRDQLRAIIAQSRPTLAQSLARPPAPSALSRLAGDDAPYEEVPMPGGVTEVHVHGGCFRLVPTARAQYDPFNHAGERLTAPCTGSH